MPLKKKNAAAQGHRKNKENALLEEIGFSKKEKPQFSVQALIAVLVNRRTCL